MGPEYMLWDVKVNYEVENQSRWNAESFTACSAVISTLADDVCTRTAVVIISAVTVH